MRAYLKQIFGGFLKTKFGLYLSRYNIFRAFTFWALTYFRWIEELYKFTEKREQDFVAGAKIGRIIYDQDKLLLEKEYQQYRLEKYPILQKWLDFRNFLAQSKLRFSGWLVTVPLVGKFVRFYQEYDERYEKQRRKLEEALDYAGFEASNAFYEYLARIDATLLPFAIMSFLWHFWVNFWWYFFVFRSLELQAQSWLYWRVEAFLYSTFLYLWCAYSELRDKNSRVLRKLFIVIDYFELLICGALDFCAVISPIKLYDLLARGFVKAFVETPGVAIRKRLFTYLTPEELKLKRRLYKFKIAWVEKLIL
jgi:hypothetical protein